MYLGRAESLIDYWAREAGAEEAQPMSPAEIAAKFGGAVVPGGRRG